MSDQVREITRNLFGLTTRLYEAAVQFSGSAHGASLGLSVYMHESELRPEAVLPLEIVECGPVVVADERNTFAYKLLHLAERFPDVPATAMIHDLAHSVAALGDRDRLTVALEQLLADAVVDPWAHAPVHIRNHRTIALARITSFPPVHWFGTGGKMVVHVGLIADEVESPLHGIEEVVLPHVFVCLHVRIVGSVPAGALCNRDLAVGK